MAILQGLLALVSKSASTVLNAIFGWAVLALFGRSSPKQQTLLSGLVGMAAAWPLLVVGIAAPKVVTFLVAFVPLAKHVPSLAIRIVWAILALAVPVTVGLVMATKAPPGTPREPFFMRVLRGFPITLGIALAFLIMFVTVPVLRAISFFRKRQDEHVTCITEGGEYEVVAAHIDHILERYELGAVRAQPSWWLAGPSRVLQALCGKALRGVLPERLAYWKGPDLEVAFYPSDVLVRGRAGTAGFTHGLVAEQLVFTAGLQTFDPTAQKVERQLRALARDVASGPTDGAAPRLAALVEAMSTLHVGYDDWQVLYRQAGQVGRAIDHEPQLMELRFPPTANAGGAKIGAPAVEASAGLAEASTPALVGRMLDEAGQLVKKELELGRVALEDKRRV